MGLTIQRAGPVCVATVEGMLNSSAVQEMNDAVKDLASDPELIGVLLNCENIAHMDSSGLGSLVATYKAMQKIGKKFALIRVPNRVADVLSITRLDSVIQVYADEKEAGTRLAEESSSEPRP